jgi:PTS system fructose-specific IIA component
MRLTELFVPETVVTDMPPAEKEALLEAIVNDLDAKGFIADRRTALADVIARERVMSTGVGNGVAIPHAYTDGVDRLVAGVYRTAAGVAFGAPDDVDVNVLFVVLGPKRTRREHIRLLAKISRLLNHAEFRNDIRRADDAPGVIGVLRRFGDR